MNTADIIKRLRENVTVDVPFAGKVLGNLSPNGAYEAAKRVNRETGETALGVPIIEAGKRKRVASIHILKKLGIASAAEIQPAVQSPKPIISGPPDAVDP